MFILLKIKIRDREIISYRVKLSHCLTNTFNTGYLIFQVEAIHIYYKKYCTESNVGDGICHRDTKYAQHDSTFYVIVRDKVINMNIK